MADPYDELSHLDGAFARLIDEHGRPDPFSWGELDDAVGDDPFAELVLHIISQQISTVAALTIYGRVRGLSRDGVTPTAIVSLPDAELRSAGLSAAKARSLRDLAERVLDGRVSFERLSESDDSSAEAELDAVRGVGPWSAQMFLLHHLKRPDIFPAADIGLLRGAQAAFGLPARPTPQELGERAESWRPYRSYAAALLWRAGEPR
jgi:DNA-3-methyladenine glycosylase II